jgi:hypothetical protein
VDLELRISSALWPADLPSSRQNSSSHSPTVRLRGLCIDLKTSCKQENEDWNRAEVVAKLHVARIIPLGRKLADVLGLLHASPRSGAHRFEARKPDAPSPEDQGVPVARVYKRFEKLKP